MNDKNIIICPVCQGHKFVQVIMGESVMVAHIPYVRSCPPCGGRGWFTLDMADMGIENIKMPHLKPYTKFSELESALQALVDEIRLADLYHMDQSVLQRVKALGIKVRE